MDSCSFINALNNRDYKTVKRAPKADYHNHVGLGMRFSTFEKWVGHIIEKPPSRLNGIQGLDDYMSNVTFSYVANRDGFEFTLKATIEDAIKDGVIILEASIDCNNINYFDNPADFYSCIQNCQNQYKDQILFKPELGIFKGLRESLFNCIIRDCIESGVFESIDFYGDESICNRELFSKYIQLAKIRGIKTKYHIGEFCSAQVMFDVIKDLKPDEIQHGIQACDHQELIRYLIDNNIVLHICPSSNFALGAVSQMEEHPISKLHRNGVKVTVNTDDLLIFDSSVSQEYIKLFENKVLTAEELDEIRLFSITEN